MRDTPHLHMKWLNKMAKQYGERKKIKLKKYTHWNFKWNKPFQSGKLNMK